jgi:hypothetical protein
VSDMYVWYVCFHKCSAVELYFVVFLFTEILLFSRGEGESRILNNYVFTTIILGYMLLFYNIVIVLGFF